MRLIMRFGSCLMVLLPGLGGFRYGGHRFAIVTGTSKSDDLPGFCMFCKSSQYGVSWHFEKSGPP